jgi:hypothetical protein
MQGEQMPEFEQHGWQGFWMPGRRVDGQHGIVIIIKRRFEVDLMSGTCRPAVTAPVSLMQEPWDDGELPMVSIRNPSEIALEKPRCDVIVRGTAYAPGGKPVPQFDVELRIPNLLTRRLRIFGDRHLIWYPPVKWLTPKDLEKGESWIWPDPDFSEPQPIDKLPLRYEHSYGGWAKLVMTPDADAMAAEAKVIAEVVTERREKKKEILEKLKKEEEDKKKAESKEKPKPAGIKDEKAAKAAAKAFADGGEQKLDEETARRLAEEEAKEDGMKVVSAYQFKDNLGDGPDDKPQKGDEAKDAPAEKGDAKAAPDDPLAKFFSQSSDGATAALDISALNLDDEYKADLDVRAKATARELTDEEGTLRDRATEFGDIQLHDDSWASKYLRARPEKLKRKLELGETPQMPYPSNLCGKGFVVSHMEDGVDKVPLPNIEDPDEPLQSEGFIVEITEFDLKKLKVPAGWGPYPMGWYPRAANFGVYSWDLEAAKKAKEKAKEQFDEDDPDDKASLKAIDDTEIPMMKPEAFQEAHPKMQVGEIRGDEEVYMTNLTPDGNLFFRLPGVHPTVTVDMSRGPEYLSLRIDQLLFDLEDPKQPAVEMCWRGFYKLKNYDELGTKPLRKVHIIEVDQEGWLEVKRKEVKKQEALKEGLTTSIKAITEEDEEAMGEAALEKYRAQFLRERGGKGVRLDDVSDAQVFDQTEDRQVVHDDWDASIREEKQAFIDEQKAIAEAKAKLKEKDLKAKARELADEEFGIIRDPETGEVLAVEPPQDPKGKKGK